MRLFYKMLSIAGDVKAARRGFGPVVRRQVRKQANKQFNRSLRRRIKP